MSPRVKKVYDRVLTVISMAPLDRLERNQLFDELRDHISALQNANTELHCDDDCEIGGEG